MAGAVWALMRVMREKDLHTFQHMVCVRDVAVAMGRILVLSPNDMDILEYASALHDIGKLSVPARILCKPSRLSQTEWSIMCLHPEAGARILNEIPFPGRVSEVVLQHHERCDGSGYPKGLSGKDILPETRIVMVADVYCAMSEGRPYRPALPMERIEEELVGNGSASYDSDVVNALLRLKPVLRSRKTYLPFR